MSIRAPIADLLTQFENIDGQAFTSYQTLRNKVFYHDLYIISFLHIQGSPGASPASVCQLRFNSVELGLESWCKSSESRELATADYLLRAWHEGVNTHARQNRGAQGSGSFQPLTLPPQVLRRNVVNFNREEVQLGIQISLPGSPDNRVLGHQAAVMFSKELNSVIDSLHKWVANKAQLKKQCDVVEDMMELQKRLHHYDLLAFIGDGSILPRLSGVSQSPLEEDVVAFYAPEQLAVEVELVNGGRQRGLGIRPGVNVLIGAGYHGKSTLLDALVKGVYPHIPGDGRELVITHPEAAFVCAENGRAVNGLDISGFIDNLPGKVDSKRFWTKNASGSTSEAAAIIEAVLAGTRLLLIDEDSSATNFLIKDRNMRKLIPEDTISPLFDRVQELYRRFAVSTLIVVGGSSEYLGVAEHVIAMQNYLPVCLTTESDSLELSMPKKSSKPLMLSDKRLLHSDNFDPSFRAERMGKTLPVRIKPLRHQEKILEYGNEQLDLTKQMGLVDPYQVLAVGYALLLARKRIQSKNFSPSELADVIYKMIEKEGLDILSQQTHSPAFFACPRRLELAGAINRLRNLRVEIIEE